MAGARAATEKEFPMLYKIVQNLSIGNGQPMPRIYVIDDPAMNAFATGRDPKHAVVAATTGILAKLEKIELEGVMAHELSHVKNYDTRLMGIVSVIAGSIAILADGFMHMLWWGGGSRDDDNKNANAIFLILGIAVAVLAPIAAMIIQMAVSRRREFLADASGALLTRYPEGLARALEKISGDHQQLRHANTATAHFYISNPFKGKREKSWFIHLFSTHPPVEDRIKILRSM